MKKIISLLLALLMMLSVASMVACNDTPKPTTPSTPTQPDGPDEPTGEAIEYPIATNGFSDVCIVVPADEPNVIKYAKDKLKFEVKELTGATMLSSTTEAEYEILLGNTGRPESDQVIAELEEGEYAIKVIGKKIVIAASEDAFLYEAVTDFVRKYLGEGYAELNGKTLTLKVALDVTKDGDTESNYYKIVNNKTLKASVETAFKFNHKMYDKNNLDNIPYRTQGGCFDGTYFYQGLISRTETYGMIARYNVKTGELVYSEIRTDMGHINDMTYNPKTGEIFAGNEGYTLVFDAETLEYKKTIDNVSNSFRISYCKYRNVFVVSTYDILSANLLTKKDGFKKDPIENGQVLQGIATDDCFIYSLCPDYPLPSERYLTKVAVYDWYGNLVSFITVNIDGLPEPENISIVGNDMYIQLYGSLPYIPIVKVILE